MTNPIAERIAALEAELEERNAGHEAWINLVQQCLDATDQRDKLAAALNDLIHHILEQRGLGYVKCAYRFNDVRRRSGKVHIAVILPPDDKDAFKVLFQCCFEDALGIEVQSGFAGEVNNAHFFLAVIRSPNHQVTDDTAI